MEQGIVGNKGTVEYRQGSDMIKKVYRVRQGDSLKNKTYLYKKTREYRQKKGHLLSLKKDHPPCKNGEFSATCAYFSSKFDHIIIFIKTRNKLEGCDNFCHNPLHSRSSNCNQFSQ